MQNLVYRGQDFMKSSHSCRARESGHTTTEVNLLSGLTSRLIVSATTTIHPVISCDITTYVARCNDYYWLQFVSRSSHVWILKIVRSIFSQWFTWFWLKHPCATMNAVFSTSAQSGMFWGGFCDVPFGSPPANSSNLFMVGLSAIFLKVSNPKRMKLFCALSIITLISAKHEFWKW